AILAAAKGATDIGDRAEAIKAGIAALEPGDALLIAGKGHETGQIVGSQTLPFSDHDAVAAALASRVARAQDRYGPSRKLHARWACRRHFRIRRSVSSRRTAAWSNPAACSWR